MIQRCTNINLPQFKDWGGRGIMVCERWRNSFDAFLADMGERPPKKVLDRWPNNDGNYEPGNVRWATMAESNRNRRANRVFEIAGVKGCMTDLAAHFHLNVKVVEKRLRLGWPPEAAFTAPLKQRISEWIG